MSNKLPGIAHDLLWIFCDFWRALGELVMDLLRDPSPGIRFALVSLVFIGLGVWACAW